MAEKAPKGIKAWIDLNGILAAKQSPAPEQTEEAKDKNLKAKPAKKAKQEAPKEQKVVTIVEDDIPEPEAAKPAKPSRKKPVSEQEEPSAENAAKQDEKPAKAKQKTKKTSSEPVQKEALKEEPKKDSSEKPAPKAKKKTHLEEAIEYDEKLKANINNPNYQKEAKLKDVNDQIARVKKIPLKDREALHFDLNALKAFLALLA